MTTRLEVKDCGDYTTWWAGGAMGVRGATAGARARLVCDGATLSTAAIDAEGNAVFFRNAPLVPIGSLRPTGLEVVVDGPAAGALVYERRRGLTPQTPDQTYVVPVETAGGETRHGGAARHGAAAQLGAEAQPGAEDANCTLLIRGGTARLCRAREPRAGRAAREPQRKRAAC